MTYNIINNVSQQNARSNAGRSNLIKYVSDPSIIGSKLRDSIMSDVIT